MTHGASARHLAPYLLALAVLVALAAWAVLHLAEPAPPKVVVMSTGALDGAYHAFAVRYKAHLAQYGITLELRPSAGSVENVDRLKARRDGVSLALVQGGIANAENAPELVTLGSMFYEPTWLFYRSARSIELGNQLRGKRIAIGAPGSGTRVVGLHIVREIGLAGQTSEPTHAPGASRRWKQAATTSRRRSPWSRPASAPP